MKRHKRHIGILSILVGFVAFGFMNTASAAVPDRFEIDRVEYYGPACPSGTADVDIMSGRTSFLVTYSTFQAQAGPGIPLTEASKTCTLKIWLNYPTGWTWSVADIAYRGNAILADGVDARLRLRYNFPGTPSVRQDADLEGPYLGDFELRKTLNQFVWAPCRHPTTIPMTINATGQVSNLAASDKSGLLTVEQTDGKFKIIVNVQWQRCYP